MVLSARCLSERAYLRVTRHAVYCTGGSDVVEGGASDGVLDTLLSQGYVCCMRSTPRVRYNRLSFLTGIRKEVGK